MALEDQKIDIVISKDDKKDKPMLGILDTGTVTNPKKRLAYLMKKLQLYLGFIFGPEFNKKFPGLKPTDIKIAVAYNKGNNPTSEMLEIDSVAKTDNLNQKIPVIFMEL